MCGGFTRAPFEMKGTARLLWLLLPLLLLLAGGGEGGREGNLYSMLGVSRKANQREIRSAYKRLAREWHPDKNKSPRAQEKIMEINKAYEVLSDEESRRHYDMTGETDPAPQGSRGHPHNHGFTVFQTGGGHFQFHFGGGGFGHAPQRRDTITSHYFQTTVLPESDKKLFLLNFFSDFCMQCGEVARIWDELREEMESNDVGMGSVHALHHQDIARHCGVDRVPAIVAVVNKRAFHYHGHLQIRSIRKFVKDSIPKWVIAELNFKSVDNFISESIKQNKPRILLFSPHPQPSLLYKSTAFSNKNLADFAYLSTDRRSGNSLDFLKRFGASWTVKRLLVYKEYPTPSAEIEESDLTGDALRSVVQGLRLHLPRLSSTRALESVCENEGRVCLVLVVRGIDTYNDSVTAAFRELAVWVSSDNRAPALSMAYIDEEKQDQFVGAFGGLGTLRSCAGGGKARPVLLLKRKAGLYASYDWFSEFCGSEGDGKNLMSFAATASLQYTTILPDQKDEFAPGVLGQLWNGVETGWHAIHDYFTNSDSQMLSLLTMMGAMAAMMCCLSLIGANQNTEEEEKRKHSSGKPMRKKGRRQAHGGETGANISSIVPLLDKELYQRHVEHAHKALVTVVLLYDVAEDLSIFSEAAKNHKSRQFKYFHAAFETQQPWLNDLLAVCNMESTEKEKRNEMYFGEGSVCILALFGARKQFVIFPESVNMSHTPALRNRHIVKTKKENTASGDLVDTVLNTFGFDDEHNSDTAEHCNHRESKSDDFQMKNRKNHQRDDTSEASVDGSSSKLVGEEGKRLQGALSKPPSQTEEGIDTGSNDRGLYTGDERTTDGWSEALYVWLERLEDGSLRRYSVDHWPEWRGN